VRTEIILSLHIYFVCTALTRLQIEIVTT